jgi:surface carbohydrate biosynthesis protein
VSKILILSASPGRDRVIDDNIKTELVKRGHEVIVSPCVRGGRQAFVDVQPDIVVLPPIKNPNARDTAEYAKFCSCGVISRHTEASCDWTDYKAMSQMEKQEIMGPVPYAVDTEIVWGPDEEDIMNRRGLPWKVNSVGSFATDIYFKENWKSQFKGRELFLQQFGLDPSKKTMLWATCWGFADTGPDLRVDHMEEYKGERQGRDTWMGAMNFLCAKYCSTWNILARIHPSEEMDEYKQKLDPRIKVYKESSAPEALANCDLLIHAGSTMAIEAHFAGVPAIQFCDIHQLYAKSWFTRKSPMSCVSPTVRNPDELDKMIQTVELGKSNADPKALEELERGRFGKMDGKASERAADIIEKVQGKFKLRWPRAWRNYDSEGAKKQVEEFIEQKGCSHCGEMFWMKKGQQGEIACPWCGIRLIFTGKPQ